jgi:putative two-component system response regulator
MAVVDNYDALISKRTYKEAFCHREALDTILKNRGTHFDPNIVDAFTRIERELPYVEDGLI